MPLASPLDQNSAAVTDCAPENAKRKQILDGARRCFMAFGFEASSMGEIAREAKVSKGTLYVYFDSKEALFGSLVEESKRESAERLQQLDHPAEDVAVTLTSFASGLIEKLSTPEHIALVRMVIGASEKFPGIARSFFEAGPANGARRLAAYLSDQCRRGTLEIPDPETAAWQFLGTCHHPTLIGVLLAGQDAPDAARARMLAERAVATFMAAYAVRRGA